MPTESDNTAPPVSIPAMSEMEANAALQLIAQGHLNDSIEANALLLRNKARFWDALAWLVSVGAVIGLAAGVEMLVRVA